MASNVSYSLGKGHFKKKRGEIRNSVANPTAAKSFPLVTLPKTSVSYCGEPVDSLTLPCSNPIFSFWLMAVTWGCLDE